MIRVSTGECLGVCPGNIRDRQPGLGAESGASQPRAPHPGLATMPARCAAWTAAQHDGTPAVFLRGTRFVFSARPRLRTVGTAPISPPVRSLNASHQGSAGILWRSRPGRSTNETVCHHCQKRESGPAFGSLPPPAMGPGATRTSDPGGTSPPHWARKRVHTRARPRRSRGRSRGSAPILAWTERCGLLNAEDTA